MLKNIHELAGLQSAADVSRDWREIISICGINPAERTATHKKLMSALRLLLRLVDLAPEHATLDLGWFDRMFPRAPKFPLPVKLSTYREARHRVRPVIRRLTIGATPHKSDGWDSLCKIIHKLISEERAADLLMIPLRSTLTKAARARGIQPSSLTQDALAEIHDAMSSSSERLSIRNASHLLSHAKAASWEVAARLSPSICPIRPKETSRYFVPAQLEHEINSLVKKASRKQYIEVTGEYETVAAGTRIGMVTSLRALVDSFIQSDRLDPNANSFRPLLSDKEALKAALRVYVKRVREEDIASRHAATLVRRLPIVFDRNGISSSELRNLIGGVPEFKLPPADKTMTPETIKFCRALIEQPIHRQQFLNAHCILKKKADDIITMACSRDQKLSKSQKRKVIQMGTVALFCAIETGGAPVRVRNVLGMQHGASGAWIRSTVDGFRVTIPEGHVKNARGINFTIAYGPNAFAETVSWYLDVVRPLILEDADGKSEWLVPMLSDPSRQCCYETFLDWFERLMRDEVELPCTPHNYRHGQASLLYHAHPEHLDTIAQRLGNTPNTVLKHYAWIHEELSMIEGQKLLTDLIQGSVQ